VKFTLIILSISWFFLSEIPPAGIYIVVTPPKKIPCTQKLKMLVGTKRICVAKMPIIGADEIEYVTEILYDPILKLNYINIGLSSKCVSALNETNNFLHDAQYALVADNEIICTFIIHEPLSVRFLRIGSDLDVNNLAVVRNALKKLNANPSGGELN
jgi:hypothetical protein